MLTDHSNSLEDDQVMHNITFVFIKQGIIDMNRNGNFCKGT